MKTTAQFHTPLLALALATHLPAEQPLQAHACDLSHVRLLDGPFKTVQELHRTGYVGITGTGPPVV